MVKPLIKVAMTYRKIRKGDFSVFGDFFGTPGAQPGNREADGSRKAGWTKPRIKKKKIPADTGEYVKFTEITTSQSETTTTGAAGSSTTFTTEQQITDVEWEDI